MAELELLATRLLSAQRDIVTRGAFLAALSETDCEYVDVLDSFRGVYAHSP